MSRHIQIAEYEQRKVPYSSLHLVEGFNFRTNAEKSRIDELEAKMRVEGQLTPILVEPNGSEDSFNIIDGERRYHALGRIGPKGALVSVAIRPKSTAKDAVLLNLGANFGREDVSTADQAKRFSEMEAGTYPGVELDEEGKPKDDGAKIARKDIALRVAKSTAYVGNLIRAWRALTDKCRKAWHQHDIPTDIVIGWASQSPEEQEASLESWKAAREAAKAQKGKGKAKGKKKKKSDGEGPEYVVRAKSELTEVYESFYEKLRGENAKSVDKETFNRIEGKLEALEFVLGKRKRLQFA